MKMNPVLLMVALFLALVASVSAQPRHLYLTWELEDTTTTQTIVFQTLDRAQNPRVEVRLAAGSEQVTKLASKTKMFGGGLTRRIHWVTLEKLSPGTKYVFRAGDDRYGMSRWRSFRTLPDDGRSITIATGGDMYRHPETVDLLKVAATYKPDVALIGGDIAYADGKLDRINFWDDWFDNWEDYFNPPDGPLVPMICAIGNHEVQGGFFGKKEGAPFYFTLLPQGGSPTFRRRVGSEVELTVLDTGHVTTYEAQVPYLEKVAKAAYQAKVPFHLALYHVPIYPTQADPNSFGALSGRKYWTPIFDRYRFTAGLENHDHVFKRSHPLKGHAINPEGTVYLGDGCFGRTPRKIPQVQWYHAKASSSYHVWILRTEGSTLHCEAASLGGKVLDRTTIKARF